MLTFCGPSFAWNFFWWFEKVTYLYWFDKMVCIYLRMYFFDLLAKYASVNFIQNGTPSILQSGTRSKSLKMVLALNPSQNGARSKSLKMVLAQSGLRDFGCRECYTFDSSKWYSL
ncbi:hypothetical protein Hanom_Chr10g00921671 [Helianthus anomalus]